MLFNPKLIYARNIINFGQFFLSATKQIQSAVHRYNCHAWAVVRSHMDQGGPQWAVVGHIGPRVATSGQVVG